MSKKHDRYKKHNDGFEQHDYIEPGSTDHATAVLGLEPCKADDPSKFKAQDSRKRWWRLADVTSFGVACTADYLQEALRQKLSSLDAPQPEIQSDDPFAPHYAPKLDERYTIETLPDGTFRQGGVK